MVIFAAIAMLITVLSGAILLLVTDGAQQDPGDAEIYLFLAIIGFGVPIAWSALSLLVLLTRSQTAGQYVAAIRLQTEEGAPLPLRDALLWWCCFNPLLFSWPMALVTGLPLAAVIALVLSRFTIVVFGVIITLCLLAPIVALVSAALDAQHRALHDRIVGAVAVPAA